MMLINVFNYNIRSDLNMEMDKTQSQVIVVASIISLDHLTPVVEKKSLLACCLSSALILIRSSNLSIIHQPINHWSQSPGPGVLISEAVVDCHVARHVPHPEPGHRVQHSHLPLVILHLQHYTTCVKINLNYFFLVCVCYLIQRQPVHSRVCIKMQI